MKYKNKNTTQTHIKKSKKVHSGPFCFLIWVFKIEIIILASFFIINFISNSISDKTKFIVKYNIDKTFYNITSQNTYNTVNIWSSLKENKKLSISEKDFIKENLETELEENLKYIDSKLITKRLKTLESSYHKKYKYDQTTQKYQEQNKSVYSKNIGGHYNSIFNTINIYEHLDINNISNSYDKDIFDFSECDKRVYFHELNHLITTNTFLTSLDSFILSLDDNKSNFPKSSTYTHSQNIFLEATNEIFTLEYLKNNEEYTYNQNMLYIYILAEILPEEIIRKYKFYDSPSILISGLLDIDNNIDKVYELFYSISNVCKNNYTENDFVNIHDGYAYFYDKKYNKNMSEDLEILLYLYGSKIQTDEERSFVRNYLNLENYDEILKIIPKGYFSEIYKNNHNNIYIEYTQNGIPKNINI